MKNKATHKGTCQICGATQKLPGGTLSLHGYTTRWGFFSGICAGSEYRPFEQSKDRVEGAIKNAEQQIEGLTAYSTKLKNGALDADGTCMFKFYANGRSDWQLVTLTMLETPGRMRATNQAGRTHDFWGSFYTREAETIDDFRRYFNSQYASTLDRKVIDIHGYIRWQLERIANWQPTELKPL